jgi:hypothetical protein
MPVNIRKKPKPGRYVRCSNMTFWEIGIILDSTDRVKKNQIIPKEISRYLRKSNIPATKIPARDNRPKNVCHSKRVWETG